MLPQNYRFALQDIHVATRIAKTEGRHSLLSFRSDLDQKKKKKKLVSLNQKLVCKGIKEPLIV